MISKIKIKGYKSIKEQEIKLGSINILIGANGVGKSNFISVFSFIRNLYGSSENFHAFVQKKGGADTFLYFGKKNTQIINLELEFGSGNNARRFFADINEQQDSLSVNTLGTDFYKYNSWNKEAYTSRNLIDRHSNQADYIKKDLDNIEIYHLHDTGDQSPLKGRCNINDNRVLKKDGSNIAAILYFIKEKHTKSFYRIEKTIQSIAPFFDKFVLEPNRLNREFIQLEWREKEYPDKYFNAYHLSDGTLRFICLATLLLQPNPPKTIIIDEPELGLHPVAINKLAGLIRKASHNSQLIISSQSVNLIDNFVPENIIIADRKGEETVFTKLDSESLKQWLEEYTLGEVWEKKIIGGHTYSI